MCDEAAKVMPISIHASRVGGDRGFRTAICSHMRFQSTPPGWEATPCMVIARKARSFQSTPPGWEATQTDKAPASG